MESSVKKERKNWFGKQRKKGTVELRIGKRIDLPVWVRSIDDYETTGNEWETGEGSGVGTWFDSFTPV